MRCGEIAGRDAGRSRGLLIEPIVLIGGPPGAGKTTLAGALATRLGWKTLTADDLIVAAKAVTTAETHPWLHRLAKIGHLEYFTDGHPEALIADGAELAEEGWSIIHAVVKRHQAIDLELVLDWWLLEPDKIAEVEPPVSGLYLHIDADALEAREWAIDGWRQGSSDPEAMHRNFMARSLWRNEYVAERAEATGQAVVHLSGTETVEEMVDRALELLS